MTLPKRYYLQSAVIFLASVSQKVCLWPRLQALCLLSRNSTLTLNALQGKEDVEVNFSCVCEVIYVTRCNDGFGKFRALQIVSLVDEKHYVFLSLSIKQLRHSVNLSAMFLCIYQC